MGDVSKFTWWCDECNQNRLEPENDITFEVTDPSDPVPQFTVRGLHVHIQGTVVPTNFCIWANKEGLKDLIEQLSDKMLEMEMEERMRQLIHV
jgi:hypothetical protein